MLSRIEMAEKVRTFSPEMRGVFSLSDLRNLLEAGSRDVLYRSINDLQKAGVITRFSRSFYITGNFDPLVLSQRISPESYISFGNVLARQMFIGSFPRYRVMAAKVGPKRVYSNGQYRIEQLSLQPELNFGYETVDGVRMALPEKAVLDTLYFYRRGIHFSFDIYSDIDYERLDTARTRRFLRRYKNPVFIEFARRLTNA